MSVVEKIKQIFGILEDEFKRILDEIERGCFKRQIDVFDDCVSEVSNSETKVLAVLEGYTTKRKDELVESTAEAFSKIHDEINRQLKFHGIFRSDTSIIIDANQNRFVAVSKQKLVELAELLENRPERCYKECQCCQRFDEWGGILKEKVAELTEV